jgi:hypothetical protein
MPSLLRRVGVCVTRIRPSVDRVPKGIKWPRQVVFFQHYRREAATKRHANRLHRFSALSYDFL